jgi:hypothetical protein
MLDIVTYLPHKRKLTPSGWYSFNAPCCAHNGQSPDRRQRGGLKVTDDSWSFHCFNCNYTASFVLGRAVSFRARRLLTWMGVPENEIEHLTLASLRHRSIHGLINDRQQTLNALQNIDFEERELPAFCELLTPELDAERWQYVQARGVPAHFPVMTIKNQNLRPNVVVPFTYNDRIVGHTTRYLDDRKPKYVSDVQPGYVFGVDQQQEHWQYVIVTEGIFDALSIDGVAVMHSEISDAQVKLIRSLSRQVIVVPDQDTSGMSLIDRAVELGWGVSIPEWSDCKDVNDAVQRYGKLATILSILENAETSRIKIELRKKQLIKTFNKTYEAD